MQNFLSTESNKQNTETRLGTTLERGYKDRTDTVQKSVQSQHPPYNKQNKLCITEVDKV